MRQREGSVREPDALIGPVRFDERGSGNGARPKWWDTRKRKGGQQGKTNFGLNHRATPRLYLYVVSNATFMADAPDSKSGPRRRAKLGLDQELW